MADQINLQELRNEVDRTYVGFTPNGGSIKPVHVANGAQRCIYGGYNTSLEIKRLALVSDAKGNIPAGNDIEKIYAVLEENDKIEDGISKPSIESMRNAMQRLLSADKGAYVDKKLSDSMISFTAGSKLFLTKTSIYEDTGEFIGGLICSYCQELAEYIKNILEKANDPISLLFEPISESAIHVFEKNRHEDLPAFQKPNDALKHYLKGLNESGLCLMENLKRHPNVLTKLRIFNFFCIFQLIRYITMLEAFYCEENIRPILLDFSSLPPSQSSIARASQMSYTQMHKSINRFYAWGYAQKLKEKGYTKNALLELGTPIYTKKKTNTVEHDTLWNLARERAKSCTTDEEAQLIFGETIYDLLALNATSHPVNCIKYLGTAAGVLYPPDKMHPNKRFVLSQDVLEMILRSTVSPDEILSGAELRDRLWDRFSIIIGGSSIEFDRLQNSGMLLQIDEDSLERNFTSFASLLESMDFAEIMADGILQIRLGGTD